MLEEVLHIARANVVARDPSGGDDAGHAASRDWPEADHRARTRERVFLDELSRGLPWVALVEQVKVRRRGLKKSTAQPNILFALAEL